MRAALLLFTSKRLLCVVAGSVVESSFRRGLQVPENNEGSAQVSTRHPTAEVGGNWSQTPRYSNCPADIEVQSPVGDGKCDISGDAFLTLNSAACGWDGGDCCVETCVPSMYTCSSGYDCKNPKFADVIPDTMCSVPEQIWIGNGLCDAVGAYNTFACNWDGGDCCADTCAVPPGSEPVCGSQNYTCRNPSSVHYTAAACPTDTSTYVHNGRCDSIANTQLCSWDGGDCCESSCKSGMFDCLVNNTFVCRDEDDKDYSPGMCSVEFTDWLGDNFCDVYGGYNSAACGWDRGDCCPDTCSATSPTQEVFYECGFNDYYCRDPDACRASDYSVVGDGRCDSGDANTLACGWDGGDCCAASCSNEPSNTYLCGHSASYTCLDPMLATTAETSTPVMLSTMTKSSSTATTSTTTTTTTTTSSSIAGTSSTSTLTFSSATSASSASTLAAHSSNKSTSGTSPGTTPVIAATTPPPVAHTTNILTLVSQNAATEPSSMMMPKVSATAPDTSPLAATVASVSSVIASTTDSDSWHTSNLAAQTTVAAGSLGRTIERSGNTTGGGGLTTIGATQPIQYSTSTLTPPPAPTTRVVTSGHIPLLTDWQTTPSMISSHSPALRSSVPATTPIAPITTQQETSLVTSADAMMSTVPEQLRSAIGVNARTEKALGSTEVDAMATTVSTVPDPNAVFMTNATAAPECKDVEGWVDSAGDSCEEYVANRYCGEKWQVHYVNFGMIADEACCECQCFPDCNSGGGTTSTTSSSSALNVDGNLATETEEPHASDVTIATYAVIVGSVVIVVGLVIFVGIRLGYRPAAVGAIPRPPRQALRSAGSELSPNMSFDNDPDTQDPHLEQKNTPRGQEIDHEEQKRDTIHDSWDGKLTSVLQMQRNIQARVLSKSNLGASISGSGDEERDPEVEVQWNSIKESMRRNSPPQYTSKRKQLLPPKITETRRLTTSTGVLTPRVDSLRHGWCDDEACRQAQRVLTSLHSTRTTRKLVRTLTPPNTRARRANVVIAREDGGDEDDPTQATMPIGCTRAKVFEWLFGALIYVEKHFGGPFLDPSLRIMGAPCVWSDVWRNPKNRDLLQLKTVAKSRLRKLCTRLDRKYFEGLENSADPILDVGRPSSVRALLTQTQNYNSINTESSDSWDQYAGVVATARGSWSDDELLGRGHEDGVVRHDQYADISQEPWDTNDGLEYRYIFVLLRMAVSCASEFEALLGRVCSDSTTIADAIWPKEYLIMAMNIELEQGSLPRPRPAENTDVLSATLLCDTTQDIMQTFAQLQRALGEPVRVRNNFSTRGRHPTSPVDSSGQPARRDRSPFDMRCLKCVFVLKLKNASTWRGAMQSRASVQAWRDWRARFKSQSAPLMGNAAVAELVQMLDGVDDDVAEFGVADETSQMLVEVNITLRKYHKDFQQGRVWQRVFRAREPADLCVTVALDRARETIHHPTSPRDRAHGMLSKQDVVEL